MEQKLKSTKPISIGKMRWYLWLMSRIKIPMIGYTNPKLIKVSSRSAIVSIKLRRRTRNHLKSMYFGALAVGADVTAGIHAFYHAKKTDTKISFAFKGMKAEFIKRPNGDVRFLSQDGLKVRKVLEEAIETGERVNEWVKVIATSGRNEIIAEFEMQISIKVKDFKDENDD